MSDIAVKKLPVKLGAREIDFWCSETEYDELEKATQLAAKWAKDRSLPETQEASDQQFLVRTLLTLISDTEFLKDKLSSGHHERMKVELERDQERVAKQDMERNFLTRLRRLDGKLMRVAQKTVQS